MVGEVVKWCTMLRGLRGNRGLGRVVALFAGKRLGDERDREGDVEDAGSFVGTERMFVG